MEELLTFQPEHIVRRTTEEPGNFQSQRKDGHVFPPLDRDNGPALIQSDYTFGGISLAETTGKNRSEHPPEWPFEVSSEKRSFPVTFLTEDPALYRLVFCDTFS